uniref:Uncharacterized protein n=1 Tax=Panagrolaimus sp. ES5 TaxID=591445 RepID=A0AC34FEQ2_9BILA
MAVKPDAQNTQSFTHLDKDQDQKISTKFLSIFKNYPYLLGSNQKAAENVQTTNVNKIVDPAKETELKDLKKKNERRKVLLTDTIIGANKNGTPKSRLLVPEECNPSQVKEYNREKDIKRNIFRCVGCNNNKKFIAGNIEETYFFAPIIHHPKCQSISKIEAEQRLKQNERKRSRTRSNTNVNGSKKQITNPSTSAALHNSVILKDNAELSCRISAESQLSLQNAATIVAQNEKLINIGDDAVITEDAAEKEHQSRKRPSDETLATSIPLKQQKCVSDNAYINFTDPPSMIEPSTTEQQNVPESSKSCETYIFGYPSKKWLINVCRKLGLIYCHNAYKLWGIIDIKLLKDTSVPRYVQEVRGGKNSFYRALSFLLSGAEDTEVKNVIRNYFYQNFTTLAESNSFNKSMSAEKMTSFLWETIAKWLECRVGIYENEKLLKFGDWSRYNDDEIITLLFEKDGENYSIVTFLNED